MGLDNDRTRFRRARVEVPTRSARPSATRPATEGMEFTAKKPETIDEDYFGIKQQIERKKRIDTYKEAIEINKNRLKVGGKKAKSAVIQRWSKLSDIHKNWAKGSLAFVAVMVVGLPFALNHFNKADDSQTGNETLGSSEVIVLEKPDFDVVLPSGKSEDDMLASQTRVTPSEDIIFSYSDMLGGVEIEVTQQKIPDTLKTNQTEQLKKLAESFQLSNEIPTDGFTIYHGLSVEQGVQSLITIYAERMLFIRSPQKLSDDVWSAYITSLR
jgi:hypothetical protein